MTEPLSPNHDDELFANSVQTIFHNRDFEELLAPNPEVVRSNLAEYVRRMVATGRIGTAEAEAFVLRQESASVPELLQETVNALADDAISMLDQPHRDVRSKYLFRGACIATMNARVTLAPSGTPLILFDQGALTFLRLAARALTAMMSETTRNLGIRLWAALVRSLAFEDAVAFAAAREMYAHARDEDDQWKTIESLSQSGAVWLLLHEIGHVQLGHFRRDTFHEEPVGGTRVGVYTPEQQRELDADGFASEALLRSTGGVGGGVLLAMRVLAHVDEARGAARSEPHSHPSWNARLDSLLTHDRLDQTVVQFDTVLAYIVQASTPYVGDPTLGGILVRDQDAR